MTNTNTDTPHPPPPPPAPDTAALNAQIATLRGWTCQNVETRYPVPLREQKSPMDRLTPPIKHERWFPPGEHYDLPLPDYAGDPAAALRLLEYCQTIRGVSRGRVMNDIGGIKFTIYTDTRQVVEWSIWRGPNGYAEADTLPLAIALSCRDALSSLQGDTDNGTA